VIPVIDVPQGAVDRSQGDVHPLGNPHYWLDPDNGKRIARLFRDKFTELDPAGAAEYAANTREFEARLDAAAREWADDLAKIRGKPVVAWHTSWRYFAEYTGMNIVGFMEPKPGVPPSPSHLAGLILAMQRTGAKVIVMEPFYDRKIADFVASKTGAKVLVLPPSVGGVKAVTDYIALMKYDISQLASAL
jgi:zinc/manganese transport system substrate-binding protein